MSMRCLILAPHTLCDSATATELTDADCLHSMIPMDTRTSVSMSWGLTRALTGEVHPVIFLHSHILCLHNPGVLYARSNSY